jgi:hypothetical protein
MGCALGFATSISFLVSRGGDRFAAGAGTQTIAGARPDRIFAAAPGHGRDLAATAQA